MDIVVVAPTGVTGQSYAGSATAENGTPPYTYSIQSGTIPDGLAYDPVTGAITGVPTTANPYSWTAEAVDSSVIPVTVDQPIDQLITTSVIALETSVATFNQPYSGQVTTSGGVAPYTYAIVAGLLPPGFSLDPATGIISGTSLQSGSYDATVQSTDSADTVPNVVTADLPLIVSAAGAMSNPQAMQLAKNFQRDCKNIPASVSLKIDFTQLPRKTFQVWEFNSQRYIPVLYSQYDFSVSQLNGNQQMDAVRGLIFNMNWWPSQLYQQNSLPFGPFEQLVIFNNSTGQKYVFEPNQQNGANNLFGSGQVPLYAAPNDTISIRLWAQSDSTTVLGVGNFQFTSEDIRFPFFSTASAEIWGQN